MTPKEHSATLTKLEKLFLSRRECAWCNQRLDRNSCAAIEEPCEDSDIINRRKRCLKTYKPK